MLRSVSGRVQNPDGHIAESEHVAVAHTEEREMGGGFGEQDVRCAGGLSECTAGGYVVGVKMRVDDVANPHAGRFSRLEVRRGVSERIDNSAGGPSAAAKKV